MVTSKLSLDILIVEDNPADILIAKQELKRSKFISYDDWCIHEARSLSDALEILERSDIDIILLDCSLPDAFGLSGLEKILGAYPEMPVILLTGSDDDEISLEALQAGAQDYLIKGIDHGLERSIRYSLERAENKKSLIEARQEALAASVAKSIFLANMSHEIRTPLTAIIGFSEILLKEASEVGYNSDCAESVFRNGTHLLEVVNDILDLSKIEAGKMECEIIEVSLLKMIKEVVNVTELSARSKGIELEVNYECPLPEVVNTDPVRVKQILLNLLGNAVKFTESGSVSLHVSCNLNSEEITFVVRDTGIGMSEDQVIRLFDSFVQADVTTTRKFGGSGLGLSISKQLVSLLGGVINVSSRIGEGSEFVVSIPAKVDHSRPILSKMEKVYELLTPEKVRHEEYRKKLSGKVLVAEDSLDNQELVKYLLSQVGVEYVIVDNGLSALEAGKNNEFELILMDMQMPIMDGFNATSELVTGGCMTPIVALTASTLKSQKEKCFKSGCTEYLTKPFIQSEFFEMLERYLPVSENSKEKPQDTATQNTYKNSFSADVRMMKIVEMYSEKLPQKYTDMINSLSQLEWQSLAEAAHILAGAGMFGFDEIGKLAIVLEGAAIEENEALCSEILSEIDISIRNRH